MKTDEPVLWVLFGVGIAAVGFLLSDHYDPRWGILGFAHYGAIKMFGIVLPFKYILVIAVLAFLYAGYLYWKRAKPHLN